MNPGFIFLIFFCLKTGNAIAQISPGTVKNPEVFVHGRQLNRFLDSLRYNILTDTVKFSEADIIYSGSVRRNAKDYSKLFVVNGSFIYRMDVIPSYEVVDFVKEVLDAKKIKSLVVVDSTEMARSFGPDTHNGIIMITMFTKARFNPKVGGLIMHGRNRGDNFSRTDTDDSIITN